MRAPEKNGQASERVSGLRSYQKPAQLGASALRRYFSNTEEGEGYF